MKATTAGRELFTVLLMEDHPELLEDLQWLIPRRLPGVVVRSATTMEDALAALNSDFRPDLAILDARVPLRKGLKDKADPQVANRLYELGIASILVTGYLESDDVVQYLNGRKLTSPPLAVIKKTLGPEFVNDLLGETRRYLVQRASGRICEQIERLFGGGGDEGHIRSGTAALISLQQDIEDYWNYLDDVARARVRQWFVTEQNADGHLTRLEL